MKDDFKKQIITSFFGATIFLILDIFFWIFNIGDNIIHDNGIFDVFFSLVIFSLFWAIYKSSSKSIKICYGIIFIIGVVNQIKIKISGEPLYLSDITFLRKIGSFYKLVFSSVSSKIILNAILIFVVYALILFVFYKISKKNDITLINLKARIMIIVLDVIILILLFIPNAVTKNFFLKIFLENYKIKDYSSYGTNLDYYVYYGCISGMYGTYLNNYFVEPDDYDENYLNNLLENTSEIDIENNLGTPNIIVIFSESFFDLSLLNDEIEFNKPVTSNFNNLKEKGYLVNLISPTYGGLSENAAFELLTGGTLNYFSQGYIPIVSLYNRRNATNIPSLVKILKDSDYSTKTTFVEDYYSTEKSYKKMGFDEYVELTQEDSDTTLYSDQYVTDLIIKDLEDNPQKLFSVYSMYEGHMPYYKDKFDNYDIKVIKSNLTENENEALEAYAQAIYESDNQLGRIYEYIQTIDEPTLILFLADHLPFLYSKDYSNVIYELNYFNSSDLEEYYYRLYNTQALVLSNYDISELNVPEYLGVDMLLTYIVNRMNVQTTDYYKWLESTSNVLAASNKYISMDINGNTTLINDLTDDEKETFELRNMMMYKMFIHNN